MPLGDLPGEAGFGFLTDQHLQPLSRQVGLALGDSAGEGISSGPAAWAGWNCAGPAGLAVGAFGAPAPA